MPHMTIMITCGLSHHMSSIILIAITDTKRKKIDKIKLQLKILINMLPSWWLKTVLYHAVFTSSIIMLFVPQENEWQKIFKNSFSFKQTFGSKNHLKRFYVQTICNFFYGFFFNFLPRKPE